SSLDDYLVAAFNAGASDLHLTVGLPPMIRVSGRVRPLDYAKFTPDATRELIYGILSRDQRERLETMWELDISYSVSYAARFRVNVYFQRGSLGAAFRTIPENVPRLGELGLPKAISQMAEKPRGLVLVTGPTGSGKSTTLAAMIDRINEERHEHIMSVEDPIEFLHHHKSCIVNQREVNQDTKSFAEALKHVLRQDPDVILVGEMRDLETISLAITAAETGHLVFATLHTQDAPQTVDRIIDVFPSHQQSQVRAQLAIALQGVVTQTLIPRRDGEGRVVACEVLVPTPGIRNLIREGKTHQIYSLVQTGGQHGMQTMDASLAGLVRDGRITMAAAEILIPTPAVRNLIREGKTHQIYSTLQTGGSHGMQTMDASLADLVRRGKITRELAEARSSSP
ncbi:MAG: type IV pilus twitching motility protein PilT, partial [Rubrobacter sp.]